VKRVRLRRALIAVAALLVILAAAGYFLAYAPSLPPPADLTGAIKGGSVTVGGRERTFLSYAPAGLPPNAPLLIVLHGSVQDASTMRQFSGYEFERLADAHKFLVVYPDGYEKNWNDCRRAATYPARALDIDDKGFMAALIAWAVTSQKADPARVFVVGYSNGGQLAYRLALEMPERFAGIAAISANLPTDDNSICQKSGRAVPLAIVNGTADPINPYGGGRVSLFGFGDRGTVVSSAESAAQFARLHPEARKRTPAPIGEKGAYPGLERMTWDVAGEARVVLYSVIGGGHVVSQPYYRAPRMLGRMTPEFNAPQEIWTFFSRLPPRTR
jgi:polyhydroxybutyrate depolymerase